MYYLKPFITIVIISFIAIDIVKTIKADYYYPMQSNTIYRSEDQVTQIKNKLKTHPDDALTNRKADQLINKLRNAISYQPSFADYHYQLAQLMAMKKPSTLKPQSSKPSNQQPAISNRQSALNKELTQKAINLNPTAAKYHIAYYYLTKETASVYIATQLSPMHFKLLWGKKSF